MNDDDDNNNEVILTCNFPLSSLSPLHLTNTLSSTDRRIKSNGASIDPIIYYLLLLPIYIYIIYTNCTDCLYNNIYDMI